MKYIVEIKSQEEPLGDDRYGNDTTIYSQAFTEDFANKIPQLIIYMNKPTVEPNKLIEEDV